MCNKSFFLLANYCTLIEIEMLIFIKQNISILVWNIFHLNLNHICIKSFLILCNICKKFWVFGVQQNNSTKVRKASEKLCEKADLLHSPYFQHTAAFDKVFFFLAPFGRLTIRWALFVRGSTSISEFFVPDNLFSLVQILSDHIPKCWSG